jgi:hypothetical protein
MKNFFKPEDFLTKGIFTRYIGTPANKCIFITDAANLANEKLNALIESWPVVTGKMTMGGAIVGIPFGEVLGVEDTHKARLAFIEELPKEPCKHEPIWDSKNTVFPGLISPTYYGAAHCQKCGILLEITWSEVKK